MPDTPGQHTQPTHIGSYPIERELGRGGMGVVYLARDPRLNRQVAIKVLPPALVADPSRLQRFEREARTLAALNHRNIAMIFGLEDADGQRLLVLEFVPGQTLTQKLARGGLAVDEAIRLTVQMCDGLEAAHERDVVHRDLKPDNVKVTPDGTVKVLDFGLATTRRTEEETSSGSALTVAGMVMGTPGYMSPEQARGLPTDKRTDIWATGCVLFELLSGFKAFAGETVSDCLAAILEREPDYALLPARTPSRLVELIHRCLVKDARRRLRDIGDLRIELEDVLSQPISGAFVGGAELARSGAVARLVLPLGPEHSTTLGPGAVQAAASPEWAVANSACRALTVSSDGATVVFAAKQPRQLWVRHLAATESTPIPGTANGDGPALADDGVRLAFFADGKLKRLALSGGSAVALAPAPRPQGAAWDSATESIYFVPDWQKPLMRVPAAGGAAEVAWTPDRASGETAVFAPDVLPGGRAVLLTSFVGNSLDECAIVAIDLQTGMRKPLIDGGVCPRYLPSGHIVFARGSMLLVVAFDAERLEVFGQPVRLEDKVLGNAQTGASHFALSEDGTLVIAPGEMSSESSRVVLGGRGVEGAGRPVETDGKSVSSPTVSPDGRSLCVQQNGASDALHLYDLDRPGAPGVKLTFEGDCASPLFSPDGSRVVYRGAVGGKSGLFATGVQMGSSGGTELVHATELGAAPSGFFADASGASVLVFTQTKPTGSGREVWTVELGKPESARPMLQGHANTWGASVSPDGKLVAFVSDESGRPEVYLQPTAGGARRQVSSDGGTAPLWSRSGGELYYRVERTPGAEGSPPGTYGGPGIIAVRIAVEPTFMVGRARTMFQAGTPSGGSAGAMLAPATPETRNYDVVADGLFVIAQQVEAAARVTRLNVVLNIGGEARKKAPPPARLLGAQTMKSGGFQAQSGMRTVSARVTAGPAATSMPTIETPTPRQGSPSWSPPKRSGDDPHESKTIG